MLLIQNVVSWSILSLIVAGVLCAALPGKLAKWICYLFSFVVGSANILLLMYFISGGQSYLYPMGHYGAPFGNELRSGPLEAFLCAMFSFVLFFSLIGGAKHIQEDIKGKKLNLYYVSVTFLLCSMIALVNTNDLFTAYVFIEINTITACGIILAKEGKQSLAAATRYLIMSLVGSGLFLIGICMMYGVTGHLLMEPIRLSIESFSDNPRNMLVVYIATTLFAVGMALKSALWPFHSWLPEAHSSATASSSALLSGLVLKAYIFLLIKIIYRVLGIHLASSDPIFDILLVFGAAAMIMGSINALREKDLKRMLAYSSVGQIGYIYLAIGFGTEAGVIAAVVQMLAHAITKAMLFISAGGIMDVSGGSKKFKDIAGAAKRDPLAGIAFFVGSMSMIGLPFFAGFVTKYSLVGAAASLGTWRMYLAFIAIIVSTLLTAVYYIMTLAVLFGPGDGEKKKLPFGYVIALIVFIAANIAVGSSTEQLMELIRLGFSMFA